MPIPHAERAVADIRKLRDYRLNPLHDEGKHKARLFAAVGIVASDAEELLNALLNAVKKHDVQLGRRDAFGQRYILDFVLEWRGQRTMLRSGWIIEHGTDAPRLNNVLSSVSGEGKMRPPIKLLDVVALTVDLPEHHLSRGQVGTVVEVLAGGEAFEVEFSDREGRTYESLGLRPDQIMVLRYEPLPPSPPASEPA
jgi:hypothetical protein